MYNRLVLLGWSLSIFILLQPNLFGTESFVNTEIYIKLSTLPPFDTVQGEVLGLPNLDTTLQELLGRHSCTSMVKWLPFVSGRDAAKWYHLQFSSGQDIQALNDSLNVLPYIDTTDLISTLSPAPDIDTIQPDPSQLAYPWAPILLGLDSAHLVEDGESSGVVIGIICEKPFEWGHPALIGNLWINPGEDRNHNGTLENWYYTKDSNGLSGDYDSVDNDGDRYVDNVLGGRWSEAEISMAMHNGNNHETSAAGIAASTGALGDPGACPGCKLAAFNINEWSKCVEIGLTYGIRVFSQSFSQSDASMNNRERQAMADLTSDTGIFFIAAGNDYVPSKGLYNYSSYKDYAIVEVGGFYYTDSGGAPDNFWPMGTYGPSLNFVGPAIGYRTTKPGGAIGGFINTSAATPLLAGSFSLMLAHSRRLGLNWTIDSIRQRLATQATRLEALETA